MPNPANSDDALPHLSPGELKHTRLAEAFAQWSYERRANRRRRLAWLLLVATCGSTFWVGCLGWVGAVDALFGNWALAAAGVRLGWPIGLAYMVAIMAILGAHELGHFLTARAYRVPTTPPFFIPAPILPFGTLGAVLGMNLRASDRRSLFDIAAAGPWAGLAVAVPALAVGLLLTDASAVARPGDWLLDPPPLARALAAVIRSDLGEAIVHSRHPLYVAGWVGMLVTGLNLAPVGQLDGGHVLFALVGRKAAGRLARLFWVSAAAAAWWTEAYQWIPMMLIVLMLGMRHPPTGDDQQPLGWPRTVLGWLTLPMMIACLPLGGVIVSP